MPESSQPGGRPVLEIRKYPNRRYYDTTRSCHVTLEGIRSLIREGHDIRVIDSKTSKVITAQVLIQIILDLESRKLDMFPVEFLAWMIRLNDTLAQDYIVKQLSQNIMSYMEWQRKIGESYGSSFLNPFGTPFGGWPPTPPWGPGASSPPPPSPGSASPPADAEAAAMRARIAELEAALAAAGERKSRAGKAPRSGGRGRGADSKK